MESISTALEEFFIALGNPILQAFCAGLFTWILTAIGAGLVFFFPSSTSELYVKSRNYIKYLIHNILTTMKIILIGNH